jgi:hypothetical protein
MLPGFIVGLVAEWLRRGLQILAPRFDSGRGLQTNQWLTESRPGVRKASSVIRQYRSRDPNRGAPADSDDAADGRNTVAMS